MKVVVAMSGGLDSSVAALRLLEAGHHVTGVLFRLWDPLAGAASRCCSDEDVRDAHRVAETLGIALQEVCTSRRFFDEIFMAALEEYAAGRTPNPCVVCNQRIKFAELETVRRESGADAVATGHYARVERDEGGRIRLLRAADARKDQSYFLYRVPRPVLERLLLPVGGLAKDEVRRLAREAGLPVAAKDESQELCFVPRGTSHAELVESWLPEAPRPGEIVDREGRVLGRHGGVHRFTVGQRRGLGIAAGLPLYVVALEADSGRIVVGTAGELDVREILVRDTVWIAGEPPADRFRCTVKIRSRHRGTEAEIMVDGDRLHITGAEPFHAPAPGQAAVLYRGEEVLGGGVIETGAAPTDHPSREAPAARR
ncbi:MAG TPA: tRNA 2-thiouridine(34) synthase MnmA [Acidobacteria bacterium]|nr:tRNA 2-thiouridine(34) synthase MnmA [Acidobacteriota bacterium]